MIGCRALTCFPPCWFCLRRNLWKKTHPKEKPRDLKDITSRDNHFAWKILLILFLTWCPFCCASVLSEKSSGENLWASFIDNKDKINYLNKLLWQTWRMLAGEAQEETRGEDPSLCHTIIHVFLHAEFQSGYQQGIKKITPMQQHKTNNYLHTPRECLIKKSWKYWYCWKVWLST